MKSRSTFPSILASTLLTFSISSICLGQYDIGHTTLTFNDPGRTGGFGSGGGAGRQIQTEIYYPATVAGEDVALAPGSFPVIVFGHGFAMTWDAYANIWEALAPEGFILAFPRTEGNLFPSPSHGDFGLDLALIAERMQAENNLPTSLFQNGVSTKTALMGHSMGGGATVLAASSNANIHAVICLAPAETTPSAIAAAVNVSAPSLIFSADEDFVTPPVDHHIPIYNALGSSCKYFVNIMGGGHCYYANSNFNCDFGESSSGGNITISRSEQQAAMLRYALPWLRLYLYEDCDQNMVFESDIQSDLEVNYQATCTGFPMPNYDLNINLSQGTLTSAEDNSVYQWIDCTNGNQPIPGANAQAFQPSQNGSYAVILGSGNCADTSACVNVNGLGLTALAPSESELVKIIDFMGREVPVCTNTPLIYVYADGTRRRVILIEE
jgi:dienelactone hydrolase